MSTFTRLLLNPQKRTGRKLILDPQSMHAAVRASFPPDLDTSNGRILWRVDSEAISHTKVLYIVSPEAPETEHLVEQAGWNTRPAQTADYSPLLHRIQRGQQWKFRLKANPVRAVKGTEDRGVIRPHVTAAQQTQWLMEKAPRHGFEILKADEDVSGGESASVTHREDLSFNRTDRQTGGRGRVTLRTAQFDGVLQVTDVDAMRESLVRGIGRGKAYGCGLLTISTLRF